MNNRHAIGFVGLFLLVILAALMQLLLPGCMSNKTIVEHLEIHSPSKAAAASTAEIAQNVAKNQAAETGLQQADSAAAGGQSVVINIGVQSKPVDVSAANAAIKGNALGDSALKLIPGAAGAAIGAGLGGPAGAALGAGAAEITADQIAKILPDMNTAGGDTGAPAENESNPPIGAVALPSAAGQ
jgi:hypothetical protein